MKENSRASEAIRKYQQDIIKRGGDPAVASFYQDYYEFGPGGGKGSRQRAEFKVIYDRTQNGNTLNRLFRSTIGLGQRGLIPRLSTRPDTVPIFQGFSALHRGGFVKVLAASDYDFQKGYD